MCHWHLCHWHLCHWHLCHWYHLHLCHWHLLHWHLCICCRHKWSSYYLLWILSRHCLLISLVRLDSWNCRLNNCSCWLGNCCSCNCSTFNSLASSHFLLNSMLNSFFLSWVLDFFFNSLLWNVVSLSLIANFWNIFYLMVNNLVFSDVFIYWNSNSLFKLVIFSYYLLIRNIFKSAFSSHNLTKFRSNSCSLKQNSLSYWFNIRLSTHHSSFNNNWLALYWWRAASTSDYLTSHSSSHCWKLNLLWSIGSGISGLCVLSINSWRLCYHICHW